MIDQIIPALGVGASSPVRTETAISPQPSVAATGEDFGSVLARMATDAVDTVKNAEAVSISGVKGEASVQQVVEAVMSAEQTLQTAIAIRDKAVAAYMEISRMTI